MIAHMQGEVYGRAAELAAIESFLGAVPDGPAALVLEGEPGVGKTTLLRVATHAAGERAMQVLSCSAGPSETRLSYASLADLLGEIDSEVAGDLPYPQREALDGALKRDHSGTEAADPRAVATAALSVIEEIAQERPLVLAIDDFQWLDRPSARVIEFCARRLTGHVGLVVVQRPSTVSAVPVTGLALREPGRMDVRRVEPLSLSAIRRLLRRRTAMPLARRTLERIHEVSGGNPFYALELARALPADSPALSALPMPASLKEVVEARLSDLGPELEEALLAVAAMADPTVELITAALGPGSETLLDEAEDRGLIERDGHRLRFVHSLLAAGIQARASTTAWRGIHRRLSTVVPDIEERARHLAYARVTPDAGCALDEAARVVRLRGAPGAAAELLELALELGGEAPLMVRAAEHHFDAGDLGRAQELLARAIPRLPKGNPRADALRLLAEIRYHDDSYPEARALLEKARGEGGLDERLGVMIDLRLAFVLCNLGHVVAAEAPAWSALAGAEALGDEALSAEALALSATIDFALGLGVHEARLARALQLESPDVRTASVLRPSLVAAFLYLWTGRLEQSRRLLTALCDWHAERGEDHELAWASFTLVWLECWRGNLAAATQAAGDSTERLQQLGTRNGRALGLAARAQVAAYAGRVEEARVSAEEALELFQRTGWQTASWRPLSTLGFLELSVGDSEAAADRLGPVALGAASAGLVAPVTWGGALSYGDAAEALVGVGKIEEAETIVTLLERHGSAWQRGAAARCRGLMFAAAGDLPAAEQALQYALAVHERLPIPLEKARGLLLLGRVQRRRRKQVAAKATLEQALSIFDSIGSPMWARQVQVELAGISVPASGPDGLTEPEELVARLAASGLTNREVAQAIHVSPKTVELHLGRAYRKLGIRSRAELGAHMALREASSEGPAESFNAA